MIGKSLRTILLTSEAITALVGDRITPVKSEQAKAFPCLFYGTDNLTGIPCRSGGGSYIGTVEISIMAGSPNQIDELTGEVRALLDDKELAAAGYAISFDVGVTGPDDEEEQVYYRRLDCQVLASRL